MSAASENSVFQNMTLLPLLKVCNIIGKGDGKQKSEKNDGFQSTEVIDVFWVFRLIQLLAIMSTAE